MIVLDASAAVAWLLGLPGSRGVDVHVTDATMHAPELFVLEAAQALRRFSGHGDLSHARAAEALSDLTDMDVTLYPHRPLLPRAWQLRDNLTIYDASYLTLAEALDARVLTMDARLARAPSMGHRALLVSR